jgi:hypothetical protein
MRHISLTLQASIAKFWPTPLVVLKSSDIIVIHKVMNNGHHTRIEIKKLRQKKYIDIKWGLKTHLTINFGARKSLMLNF